jgi:hypothetical protein
MRTQMERKLEWEWNDNWNEKKRKWNGNVERMLEQQYMFMYAHTSKICMV